MLIGNKIPQNADFWQYLNYQLRNIFNEKMEYEYHFNFIYQLQGTEIDLPKKRKTNQSVTVNTIIVFNNNGEEIEYLGKLVLGKYSIKAYAKMKGADFVTCYPKEDYDKWIKIDKPNTVIEITLN